MAIPAVKTFSPRKQPVQARSTVTVEVLLEACLQVLLSSGYRKLTTTRVAERAGVSVGTVYQYFPNRQALMAAVLQRYLDEVVAASGQACRSLMHQPLTVLAPGLADGVLAAKAARPDLAHALHEPLSDVDGTGRVRTAMNEVARSIAALLTTCTDTVFDDPAGVSAFLVTACSAVMQATLSRDALEPTLQALRQHLSAMVSGYLGAVGRPSPEPALAQAGSG